MLTSTRREPALCFRVTPGQGQRGFGRGSEGGTTSECRGRWEGSEGVGVGDKCCWRELGPGAKGKEWLGRPLVGGHGGSGRNGHTSMPWV